MFGVNKKSFRRGLNVLSRDYPITEEPDGREVCYGYGDGYNFEPPPLLMPGE